MESIVLDAIIDDMLEKIDINNGRNNYNNAGFVSQVLMNLADETGISIIDFEDILRSKNSRVYFISIPLHYFNNPLLKLYYPKANDTYTRALWICMNGLKERNDKLKELGIAETSNYIFLKKDTGFLTI